MKKLIGLITILMLVSAPVFAYCYYCEDESDVTNITNVTNEVVDERDNPAGIGLDVIVYRSDVWWAETITVESRFDFENDEQAVFVVADVDLYKFISSFGESTE